MKKWEIIATLPLTLEPQRLVRFPLQADRWWLVRLEQLSRALARRSHLVERVGSRVQLLVLHP
jgi:hypothetical protein